MTHIITAINNKKIYNELQNNNNIKIISKDIQYKEGILEILEKNQKINFIILKENLPGQIKNIELINKIKIINSKIKLIFILNKKDNIKEKYFKNNNIKYIYYSEINIKKILEIINIENKIISILGSSGGGKTINLLLMSRLLSENKKILIIEENKSIINLFKNRKINQEIIEIKNNMFLLDINSLNLKDNLTNKINYKLIINKINFIKNNYDYIFIEISNLYKYKLYEKVINKNIFILNSNLLEINKNQKIINYLLNKNNRINVILNNYNQNSISEKILKNIFNNKIKIIEKLKNNKNYNLIINNNFNIKYLDISTKNKIIKIINNI